MVFKKKIKPAKVEKIEIEPDPEPEKVEVEKEPELPPLPPKKEEDPVWIVKQVATQVEPMVFNSEEEKPYTVIQALVELLNRTE